MTYEIEKGVPLPIVRPGLAVALKQMEVSDSILIADRTRDVIAASVFRLRPKKFSLRKAEVGHRVWRVA